MEEGGENVNKKREAEQALCGGAMTGAAAAYEVCYFLSFSTLTTSHSTCTFNYTTTQLRSEAAQHVTPRSTTQHHAAPRSTT